MNPFHPPFEKEQRRENHFATAHEQTAQGRYLVCSLFKEERPPRVGEFYGIAFLLLKRVRDCSGYRSLILPVSRI